MDSAFRRSYAGVEQALGQVLGDEAGQDAGRVADDLWSVGRVLQANPSLRRGLADPSREGSDKAALAERLLAGKIGEGALHLVRTVVAQRWTTAGDLSSALDRAGVEAILAHADRQGRLAKVEDELFRFGRIVAAHPELQAALTDQGADTAARAQVVDRLLSIKATPETVRLATHAVSGVRGQRFDRAVQGYLDQIDQRKSQLTATVTTAVPLSPEQHQRLVNALSTQYGRQVRTNVVIDERVVGGIKVEIGDEVIDGTISQRLEHARRLMTG